MTTFETEIEERAGDDGLAYGGHLIHQDGSHTFVYYGDQDDHDSANPREHDGNVIRLVMTRDQYKPLDEPDADLEAMRNACDFLGERWVRTTTNMFDRTNGWRLNHYEDEEREEWHLVIPLPAPMYSGGNIWLDLDDKFESVAALGYLQGLDAEECMKLFAERFCPDVAHYEHHWQVTGSMQSDWAEGWAYVLYRHLEEAGVTHTPAEAYEAEFSVYRQWFAGEVYHAAHVMPGDLEFAIGDQGGYYLETHEASVDTCGGFLAYKDFPELATNFTDSPVTARSNP